MSGNSDSHDQNSCCGKVISATIPSISSTSSSSLSVAKRREAKMAMVTEVITDEANLTGFQTLMNWEL